MDGAVEFSEANGWGDMSATTVVVVVMEGMGGRKTADDASTSDSQTFVVSTHKVDVQPSLKYHDTVV